MKRYRQLITTVILAIIVFSCNMGSKTNVNTTLLKGEGVHAAFYNSKGSRIALATTKGRLILTDSALNIIASIQAHNGPANSSFFSLNDSFIVTGGADRVIRKWSAFTLELIEEFRFDFNSHTTVHGYHSVAGCGEKGTVVSYDFLKKDTTRLNLDLIGAYHIYYSVPDNRVVISSGKAGYEVDLNTKNITHTYRKNSVVYCIMPDQENKLVVIASADSTVTTFSMNNENIISQSGKLDGAVYVACFSNDGKKIAASTSSGSIYFFDQSLTRTVSHTKAFRNCINTIHYSPDGNFMVAGSLDPEQGGVKLFSLKDNREIKALLNSVN